jgi:hypothetical protein
MNAFRGVPVLHDASIMMLGQGNLALKVHPHQVLCIAMEKRTYLKSDMLTQVVRAYSVSTNVRQGEVVLARFAPARSSVGNRLSLRVQPREPLRVLLRTAQKETLATLADLSAKGVGVFYFAAVTGEELDAHQSDELEVELVLPPHGKKLVMPGKVTNTGRERGDMLFRLGLQTFPKPEIEVMLLDYIALRQLEIMEELEAMYQTMTIIK